MAFVILPEIDLETYLMDYPLSKPIHIDRIRMMLYRYFTIFNYDKEARNESGYVYIHSNAFKEICSDYHTILDWLEEREILVISHFYFKGFQPRRYKLNDQFLACRIVTYSITDTRSKNKFYKCFNYIHELSSRNHKGLLADFTSKKLGFTENVGNVISQLFEHDSEIYDIREAHRRRINNEINIQNIFNHNYWFYQDNTGNRLHTNLTNLKSEIKKELTYNGEKLIEIDISNSQPYFSTLILKRYYIYMFPENVEMPIPVDFQGYINLCVSGEIYEYFENCLAEKYGADFLQVFVARQARFRGLLKYKRVRKKIKYGQVGFRPDNVKLGWIPENLIGKSNRKIVKSMFFKVLYGRVQTNPSDDIKRLFKETFPTVYGILNYIDNHAGVRNLAVELQKLEADVILNKIVKQIKARNRNIPLFTVHDCILTTERHKEYVLEVMNTVLTEVVGHSPKLHHD